MDSELNYLNKLREGDHKAFDKIYLHYGKLVPLFFTSFHYLCTK